MTEHLAQWVFALVTSLLSCGGTSAIILYRLKRKDKVERLVKVVSRQSEGIGCLVKSQIMLTEALHQKGLLDGEAERIRKQLQEYLLECTGSGFAV